jgi:hypothetical protein
MQALGGGRDRTDVREQLPPSAPSKSEDCSRLTGQRRMEVKAWSLTVPTKNLLLVGIVAVAADDE